MPVPINFPLGTYRDGRWAGYRLTTGDRYLLLPHALDRKLQDTSKPVYWRFMTRQLRKLGIASTPETAWRLFAD